MVTGSPRRHPFFDGPVAYLLDQAYGYVYAFVLSLPIVPLALLGVLDTAWLALPGALSFPAAVALAVGFARARRREASS